MEELERLLWRQVLDRTHGIAPSAHSLPSTEVA
jgi:hypothetical protein